ncbi:MULTISPECIES: DUF5067 domain-containing protein [Mediterraneibacter]|jgi:hypothetical protein|uniref:DUF5067 domain-containing protein n=1 Tax=Mediterraneibacter TaxID=2316020 RepID=UPI000E47AC7A|nr:DUF5067 domain-containing protein [Mediterraneibacter massiliensis]RGT71662.1 DUF5067 domain-containing protein [Ruminococcus sp. AF18-22]
MKKKFLATLLTLAICLGLAACGGSSDSSGSSDDSKKAGKTASAEKKEAEEESVYFRDDVLQTEECTIKITNTEIIPAENNYSLGVPAVIFTYEYTNNSDENKTPAAVWPLYMTPTQETDATVETLNAGMTPTGSPYDELVNASIAQVKPGGTVTACIAYNANYADKPVTLTAVASFMGEELGTKTIELQ